MLIFFGMMASLGACYWFMLPAIQSQIIPSAPAGKTGPWVIRPILAFHFGAVAVLVCASLPVALRPLRTIWRRKDAALGSRYDPFRDRPMKRVVLLIKGSLLALLYASALVFYLFSWTIIGAHGIEQRLPWATLHHSFQDIQSLETIPEGARSDSIAQNGPWYSIKLRSGRSITLSHDNEGGTPDELKEATSFIAARSGLSWSKRSDVRRH